MDDNKSTPVSTGTAHAQPSGAIATPRVRLDRRALLRAGAAATPVLLTLASGPVSATNSCVVASSFVSVTTFKSRNPGVTVVKCTTMNCEDWVSACKTQPRSPAVTPFVYSLLGGTTSGYNGKRLYEVLQDPKGIVLTDELGVLQHIICLSLCVSTGKVTSPGNVDSAYLRAMWQNYKANGNLYRLPASGIDWDSTKLVGWLRYQLYPIAV